MEYEIGSKAFIIESNRIFREVTIVRKNSDFYIVRFDNNGSIQLRKSRKKPDLPYQGSCRIAITVFPEDTKSYILLSCLSREKHIYANFFEQINNASLGKIKFYFSMILPLYSENMVLSPVLWNKWDDEIKMAFTFYADLNGQTFKRYNIAIGMGLKNAANSKTPFDYSKRGKIDLFKK